MQHKYNEPIFGHKKRTSGFQFSHSSNIFLGINSLRKLLTFSARENALWLLFAYFIRLILRFDEVEEVEKDDENQME